MEAIKFLQSQAGTLLDPVVVDALRLVVMRRKSLVFME